MAYNNTAVLDVVVENKIASAILKENAQSESPSRCSLLNSRRISSSALEESHCIDLIVKVDSPQKVLDTLETYITFQITTKVTRREFSENEYIVRRRYNDFIWLRQRLVECHPFCIVPPLPAKHTLMGQLDRYSKEFILIRMKALNAFISRIVEHPILNCNEHFKVFITAKQGCFLAHQKQKTQPMYKLLSLNNTALPTILKFQNVEFDDTKTYLTTLSEKLSCLDKVCNRMTKQRHDFVKDLKSFQFIFANWAESEPQLAQTLRSIADAVSENIIEEQKLISNYPEFSTPIKDLSMDVGVLQDVLRRREICQAAYENTLDELAKCYSEKEKLSGASTPSVSGISFWKRPSATDKIEKLGSYIPELVKKAEVNQDTLECANACLRSDLQRWQGEKQRTLRKVLSDYVKRQMEFHAASLRAWQRISNESEVNENCSPIV